MDKVTRPVRSRRYSRRAWPLGENHRLQKRLFTPEIKRMLKDWLVRRRENPYPSRDEKKTLAINTGLTYIQICNWFANWRRKLKNAGREPAKKTWGHLIKNYNTSANGNVEQFSICSNDSIWGDDEPTPMVYGPSDADRHQYYSETSAAVGVPPTYLINKRPLVDTVHFAAPHEYYDHRFDRAISNGNSKPFRAVSYENNNKLHTYYGYFTSNVYDTHSMHDAQQKNCTSDGAGLIHGPLLMRGGPQEQCFQISSTTNNHHHKQQTTAQASPNSSNSSSSPPVFHLPSAEVPKTVQQHPLPVTVFSTNAKYKNSIMEKYLRDLDPTGEHQPQNNINKQIGMRTMMRQTTDGSSVVDKSASSEYVSGVGMEVSTWLQSAAKFTPIKNNYIEWDTARNTTTIPEKVPSVPLPIIAAHCDHPDYAVMNHEREELEAAEALTSLAGNYRNRMQSNLAASTATAFLPANQEHR